MFRQVDGQSARHAGAPWLSVGADQVAAEPLLK